VTTWYEFVSGELAREGVDEVPIPSLDDCRKVVAGAIDGDTKEFKKLLGLFRFARAPMSDEEKRCLDVIQTGYEECKWVHEVKSERVSRRKQEHWPIRRNKGEPFIS